MIRTVAIDESPNAWDEARRRLPHEPPLREYRRMHLHVRPTPLILRCATPVLDCGDRWPQLTQAAAAAYHRKEHKRCDTGSILGAHARLQRASVVLADPNRRHGANGISAHLVRPFCVAFCAYQARRKMPVIVRAPRAIRRCCVSASIPVNARRSQPENVSIRKTVIGTSSA